jgi:hypothetical protein
VSAATSGGAETPDLMTRPAMLERDLQAQIIQVATMLGYLVFHDYNSQRSTPGFPDLVLVHERTGALILAELKRDGQHPTPAQTRWLTALARRHTAVVWRPADLRDGTITRMLQHHARATAEP